MKLAVDGRPDLMVKLVMGREAFVFLGLWGQAGNFGTNEYIHV